MNTRKQSANKKKKSVFLFAIAMLTLNVSAFSSETAEQIMIRVFNRAEPSDMRSELTMTLIDSRGRERVRRLKQLSASFTGIDKKIMEFSGPADVKGTAFMNWSYTDNSRSDDQWIYLPALNRVRRISSDGKGDSFMGSDFSYDDLGARHPNQDNHSILKEEKVNGEDCFVIESASKQKNDTYSKTVSWVSKTRDMGVKREFYDKKGNLLKILFVKETKNIDGFEIITSTEMQNIQKNHKTTMQFTNTSINTNVPNDSFSERALERGIR